MLLLFFFLATAFLVNIVKVLGEGGFSFVFLAQDEASGVSEAAFIFSSNKTRYSKKGIITETICIEKDPLSHWVGRSKRSDERG